MKLHRTITNLAVAVAMSLGFGTASLSAQDAAPATPPAAAPVAAEAPKAEEKKEETPKADAPKDATLEQRVIDLEQYYQNMGVGGSGDTTWAPKIGGVAGPGHNGFMMICTALVLFMTLPGLALFYGGLVRKKNVLSVCAQCLGIAGLVTIMWWAFGYSLVFDDSNKDSGLAAYIGGSAKFFLSGVTSAPNTNYSYWVSENVFAMYQLMFAIITPALIVGAVAERMKFSAVLLFVALWMLVVYFPMAHMVWGVTGLMNGVWNSGASIKAIDFAGGTVVHMTSGWSALILCIMLGKRMGFGKEKMAPHSMVLCMVGTGMLWVGWYGFNAGSAVAADGVAANAFMTTTLAAATAGFVWALIEKMHRGHMSVLGLCSGIVAGLVVVTPACGFITANGAMVIGVLAAIIPYIFVTFIKAKFGYDDALDTFGIHAVGGTLGAVLTGILASHDSGNTNLATNLKDLVGNGLVIEQFKAIGLTLVLSIVGTVVITFIVKAVIGLRPEPEAETSGLDITDHGEEGYIL